MDNKTAPFSVTIVSLFPEMFPGPLGFSVAGNALENHIWSLRTVDLRNFSSNKHRTVDDSPFGGGAGMVIRPDVIDAALNDVHQNDKALIYLSPRGRPFNQILAKELIAKSGVTILCGRYEGVDDRVLNAWEMDEISIGDFVLSGGEPAAIVLIDCLVRLLPGVVGSIESLNEESFENGLLEYPQYTRPESWKGMIVPEVLKSGHHKNISSWRRKMSEKVTRDRRPDLWDLHLAQKKIKERS